MFFPDNLLDVLAAAGAAKITDRRFSLPHLSRNEPQGLPAITAEQASQFIADLRGIDFSHLRLCAMDFLRGSGQMPTLDQRAQELAQIVTPEDIICYTDGRLSARISLRWEIGHEADRPAAHRWIGSRPTPRLSHPGRNALALTVVSNTLPCIFQAPPFYRHDWSILDRPHKWPFWTARRWFAPRIPISYETWLAIQQSAIDVGDDGQWYESHVAANSRALYLTAPQYWMPAA